MLAEFCSRHGAFAFLVKIFISVFAIPGGIKPEWAQALFYAFEMECIYILFDITVRFARLARSSST